MSEPGKYVLLKKVQPSSKQIKRPQKQKEKKLKKKLQKVQQKNVQKQKTSHQNSANSLVHKEGSSKKKKKVKQKPSKGDKKGTQKKYHVTENSQSTVIKNKKQTNLDATDVKVAAPKSFGDDLSNRLKASRFRFINEQLYTQTGDQAIEVFKQDDTAFTTYHEGYRQQIEKWPLNPLDRIVKSIKKLPLNYVVADFGCGEARLAESITQKCWSFDLVAANSRVIACNMAHTPLLSDSVNVAVFCLSLMGTNLKDFLLEANRILKIDGHLKIAEIESRFDNVNEFIKNVKLCGFELLSKDISTKVFYFLNFKKVQNVTDSKKIKDFSLKPCLYKKR